MTLSTSLETLDTDLSIILLEKEALDTCADKTLLELVGFEAKAKQIELLADKALLYVGMEHKEPLALQELGAAIAKKLKGYGHKRVSMDVSMLKSSKFKALVEGVLLGDYDFNDYKSEPTPKKPKTLTFIVPDAKYEEIFEEAQILAHATNFTRDLVNTTPEDIYPLQLAKIAKELADKNDLEYDAMDESQFLEHGMEAIYMVGRASRHNSQLIHVAYKPKNPKKTITLVGKGLTYDSGGLSLKPSDSMVTMKLDKSGACAVLGILKAVSELKLDIEVHGFIGAVENMIGGDAYKPDDVLRAKNGKTIEVRNTDAEGRLVLADTLCYAQEKVKSDYIFDYATLTGACVVALGAYTIGIMGHNSKIKHDISKANKHSGELTGSLPFNDYLKEELKSQVADIKNVTGRYGGAITAGLFLDHFIEEENKEKWVHFDIAGPAFTEKPWGVHPYGGTGAGVRLTVELLKHLD